MCLKRGHIVRNCQSKSKCSTCSSRHHRSLCQKAASDTTTTSVLDEFQDNICFTEGIIEKVQLGEDEPPGDKIHYLPHHAVVRQDKENTKVHVVYDASARSDGPSLNDCFHPGPKFDRRIFDLLLKF